VALPLASLGDFNRRRVCLSVCPSVGKLQIADGRRTRGTDNASTAVRSPLFVVRAVSASFTTRPFAVRPSVVQSACPVSLLLIACGAPDGLVLMHVRRSPDIENYAAGGDIQGRLDTAIASFVDPVPLTALLGPFHGAIAVPSVTRCRCCRRCRCCCGHRCAGGVRQ